MDRRRGCKDLDGSAILDVAFFTISSGEFLVLSLTMMWDVAGVLMAFDLRLFHFFSVCLFALDVGQMMETGFWMMDFEWRSWFSGR